MGIVEVLEINGGRSPLIIRDLDVYPQHPCPIGVPTLNSEEPFIGSGAKLKKLMPSIYKGFSYKAEHDERGAYVLKNELYNTNSAFNEVTRPNLVFDIYYNTETGDVKTADVSTAHVYDDYIKIAPKQNNNGTNKYHAFRWSRRKVESESHDLAFMGSSTLSVVAGVQPAFRAAVYNSIRVR